jgi:chromodomain-helicase-DNA-binding protein 7
MAADAVRPWDAAPPWWRSEHDVALLQALNDFGLLYVSSWLVDVDRPFAAHVNEFQFAELSRLAAMEAEQRRVVKPREMDDLAFLFNDKTKVSRALLVVQFVENEEMGAQPEVSEKPKVEDPGDGELPSVPWEVNGQLVVVKWGKFMRSDFQYPVGYVSHRQYHSIDNPAEKAWYEAATEIGADGTLLFRVTDLSDETRTWVHQSASGVWEQVIRAIEKTKGKLGLPKRLHTTVSGPQMYGFSMDVVLNCLDLLRK